MDMISLLYVTDDDRSAFIIKGISPPPIFNHLCFQKTKLAWVINNRWLIFLLDC